MRDLQDPLLRVCRRLRESDLKGHHDECKQSGVLPARPAAALTVRRWTLAPNADDLDLATRPQLERVEL